MLYNFGDANNNHIDIYTYAGGLFRFRYEHVY